MAPRDITYLIQSPPTYGYLEIDPPLVSTSSSGRSASDENSSRDFVGVTVFDQSVINEGRLHYIQSISNQTSDSFTFDVSNGISGTTPHFFLTGFGLMDVAMYYTHYTFWPSKEMFKLFTFV